MKPIISVFVPTKNRYVYLKNLINLVESYNDKRIELVIQDNSDNNKEILDFFEGRELISTKYYYDSSFLSMSQNSNIAVSHCTGEYVVMIGDDDAVCRNIANCCQWMKDNNIDAIRSAEVQYIYCDDHNFMYYGDIKPEYTILNPVKELKKELRKGLPEFGKFSKIYHGIVKKSVVDEIIAVGGTCFPGCTPDMSGATASCFFVKKLAYVNIPVILPGLSNMNSGGMSNKVYRVDEVPWITQETRDNWETKVPKIWAREFIWGESGSKGIRYAGMEDMLKFMNYNMMKVRYMFMHKVFDREIVSSSNKLGLLWAFIVFCISVGGRFVINRKIRARFNHKLNGVYNQIEGIPDIAAAESYFYERGYYIPFDKLILK